MPLSDDEWIASNSPIDPDKLHALGVANFHWNIVDQLLQTILGNLEGAPGGFRSLPSKRLKKIQKMTSHDVITAIRDGLGSKYNTDLSNDYINRVLDAADVCRKNRNSLVHFHVDGFYNQLQPMGLIKNYFFDHDPMPDTIAAIRQVAKDIEAVWKLMTAMLGQLTILWGLKSDRNAFQTEIPKPSDLFSKEALKRP